AGAVGFYDLSNGSVNVSAAGGVIVGSIGLGTFQHTGGTHVITSSAGLKLGDNLGAVGAYNLSAGIVDASGSVAGGVIVGNFGVGTFHHTGGVHIVTASNSALRLGASSGG